MSGVVMMTVKTLLALLLLLLTLLTGVCSRRPRDTYVKAGEMVALQCPYSESNSGDAKLIWTSYTTQGKDLTNSMLSAEQKQMGVLFHGRTLVILKASVKHQGNYSCSLRNSSRRFWFRLTVYTTQTNEYGERTTYPQTCYTQESCTLYCPDVNPLNITCNSIKWHKRGESPAGGYFLNVKESDSGVYTCTRSYLYDGQTYNMTNAVKLNVQPNKKLRKPAKITAPRMGDVSRVDLGSKVVIDCKAVMHSDFDEVLWLTGESFVERNDTLPVFYNFTRESNSEEIKMTASLVFRKVSKEDLSKNYTCKLESESQPSSFVTITLAQKASPLSCSLALSIAIITVMIAVTVLVYVKLKMDIALFLRDTLGLHRSTSDGKSYDALLMCYKSDTDAGLNEEDRNWLKGVLEDRFGYSLCLDDCDVSPGKAKAEAVLRCIEQSRMVVLVPTASGPCPGSDLLNGIHAALVERQTRLVFIKTEATEVSRSGSVSEALQLLSEAGNCVTWRGTSSVPRSSSFWKQLRYYLPAPQRASKIRFLPQTDTQDENC